MGPGRANHAAPSGRAEGARAPASAACAGSSATHTQLRLATWRGRASASTRGQRGVARFVAGGGQGDAKAGRDGMLSPSSARASAPGGLRTALGDRAVKARSAPGSTTQNSSPRCGRVGRSRAGCCATGASLCLSAASPTAWPCWSLMRLKKSMSIITTRKGPAAPRSQASAVSRPTQTRGGSRRAGQAVQPHQGLHARHQAPQQQDQHAQ